MNLFMVRATHQCIRGSRVPSSVMRTYQYYCEGGGSINLPQPASAHSEYLDLNDKSKTLAQLTQAPQD
eukprot:12308936-Ditylum_brightwellii.AAC.1